MAWSNFRATVEIMLEHNDNASAEQIKAKAIAIIDDALRSRHGWCNITQATVIERNDNSRSA